MHKMTSFINPSPINDMNKTSSFSLPRCESIILQIVDYVLHPLCFWSLIMENCMSILAENNSRAAKLEISNYTALIAPDD